MCGIWGCIGTKCTKAQQCTRKLLPRGPEFVSVKQYSNCILGFTRLALNGLNQSGNQPMEAQRIHWVCNGEIYNWVDLRDRHKLNTTSQSDCSVIGLLFKKLNNPDLFFRSLDGVFAILIYDSETNMLYAGRDPYGVRPMFIGYDSEQGVYFGSQIKSLINVCQRIQPFLPSQWAQFDARTGKQICRKTYHHIPWLKNPLWSPSYPFGFQLASQAIREGLTIAVRKRLMTERPIAALLSGGIDSSLIAALLQRQLKSKGKPPLKTFSIGIKNSHDLQYAKIVAEYIGSDHTQVCLSSEQFFNAIPQVIQAVQTYDMGTLRSSVCNWIISQQIKKRSDCKVVFNGDGSDQVFGSYQYFKNAPSQQQFEYQCGRILSDIHYFDVLRSDRSISSHGLEPRTPFLDKQFVSIARAVATQWRLRPSQKITQSCRQKWILRKSFENTGILPNQVIWRTKQPFSDGVGSKQKSWCDQVQRMTNILQPNWEQKSYRFIYLRPESAQSYYYRKIFNKIFGQKAEKCVPFFWKPKWVGLQKQ